MNVPEDQVPLTDYGLDKWEQIQQMFRAAPTKMMQETGVTPMLSRRAINQIRKNKVEIRVLRRTVQFLTRALDDVISGEVLLLKIQARETGEGSQPSAGGTGANQENPVGRISVQDNWSRKENTPATQEGAKDHQEEV